MSSLNARERLTTFIEAAGRELPIDDPKGARHIARFLSRGLAVALQPPSIRRSRMNRHFSTIVICLAMVATFGVAAQEKPVERPAGSRQMSGADEEFARKAASDGEAEVALATLAKQKSRNDEVQKLAARIHTDHSKANQELRALASRKQWTLPSEPGPEHHAVHDKLSRLDGAAFDRAYADAMVTDHQKAIKLFEDEASRGTDAETKAFASSTLPALKEHLAMATSAQRSLKSSSRQQDR